MRAWFLVALMLTVPFAGCSDDAVTIPEGFTSPVDPIPVGDGHDHADPAQHRFAKNANLLDHASLAQWGRTKETIVGAHALDRHGDLLAVAVNAGEADAGQQGFHLFDVSDPERLRHISYWDAGVAVSGDRTIAFSPDGQTVFLGFEGGDRPGIVAVDVSVPDAPQEVAFYSDPTGYGPHTISAGLIDGDTYVFALSFGVTLLRYTDEDFTFVSRFVTNDEASVLDAAMLLDPNATDPTAAAQTYALRSVYGHDMTFYHDGVTGKDLLMVAYAYDGAKIVDVTVPEVPVLQASWMPPADTSHKHYTHSMVAERGADGRLVVVVGSETFEPENQGIASPIWILDGTEAVAGQPMSGDLVLLDTWRNPGGAPAGNLGRSVHFFRLQDGFLYLSHYHGGVWFFDLRAPESRLDVQAAGYILPVPDDAVLPPEDCCIGYDLAGVPMVFDVVPDDEPGIAYAADIVQGVTALRFAVPG